MGKRRPMSMGRLGALLAFAITAIGTGLLVFYQVATGLAFIGVGLLVLIWTMSFAVWSHWDNIRAQAKNLGPAQLVLLVGILGTWLFMSITLGSAAWMIWNQKGFAIGVSAIGVGAQDEELCAEVGDGMKG